MMRVESLNDTVSALPNLLADGHRLVRFLGQRVELGNSVIKCLLGKMAGTVGAVQDLVAAPQV